MDGRMKTIYRYTFKKKKDLFDISKRDQIRETPQKVTEVTKIKPTKMRIYIRLIYYLLNDIIVK